MVRDWRDQRIELGHGAGGGRPRHLHRFGHPQRSRYRPRLLGIQEAAAHKRTARALEKLRKFFSQRGIELSAATIAGAVAANSVQAAPAGLAAAITAAALSGTAITTTAYLAATKAIAMTTIQKIAVTAALAVSVAVGIYQAKETAQARAQVQTLQQQQAPLAEQIQQLQAERDKATNMLAWRGDELAKSKANNNELLRLRGEITQLKASANNAADQAAAVLLGKVNKIKQRIEATPGAKIPELHLGTEEDWLQTAAKRLDSDIDYRRAMAHIRTLAKDKVASEFGQALSKYFKENKNQFPTDITQLKPFFKTPMDEAILKGWEIKSTDNFPLFKNVGKMMITENNAADFVFDSRHAVGDGWQSQNYLTTDPEQLSLFSTVVRAYETANNGAKWNSGITSELLPYAKTPEQQNAIQNLMTSQSD